MIPDDITPIIREIDDELKAAGVHPVGRPLQAIMRFGTRFGVSMPLGSPKLSLPGMLEENRPYTDMIYAWYETVYGDQVKMDPSASARVVVRADSDLWELRLPIIFGSAAIYLSRTLDEEREREGLRPSAYNPCNSLSKITQARLNQFNDDDLREVFDQFIAGMAVRQAFSRFSATNHFFTEAQADWMTAVMHMTSQRPSYGQSRWASLQLAEKFMKGLLTVIGDVNPVPHTHRLEVLHKALEQSIMGLDTKSLLLDIQCTAAVRYGEEPSTQAQAYSAHRNSLLLIKALGSVKNASA